MDDIPSPADALRAFHAMFERDKKIRAASGVGWARSWRHLELRLKQGALHELAFRDFMGPRHLGLMYRWIDRIAYHNFLKGRAFDTLKAQADKTDQQVFQALGLPPEEFDTAAVGLYNAQDYHFQTIAQTPARQRPRRILDFGAGHGRQANLWFRQGSAVQSFTAVDAIPAPYLTQRMYYRALGLDLNDLMDQGADGFTIVEARDTVNHLPAWRLDLVPDRSVDMIIAVQVLRELSTPMLIFALQHFARILSEDGALYIRDHIGFHNVNMLDLDKLLTAYGMVPEWTPVWIDGVDIHGIPRLWRRANVNALLGKPPNS